MIKARHESRGFAVAAFAPRDLCAAAEGQSAALFHIRGVLPAPAPLACEAQNPRTECQDTWIHLLPCPCHAAILRCSASACFRSAAQRQAPARGFVAGSLGLLLLSSVFRGSGKFLHTQCKQGPTVLVVAARVHRKSRQSRSLESSPLRPWTGTSQSLSQSPFKLSGPIQSHCPCRLNPRVALGCWWWARWAILLYDAASAHHNITTGRQLPDHGQFERKVALVCGCLQTARKTGKAGG